MKAARNDDDDNLITYLVYLQKHKNTFAINTKSLTKGYHALLSSLSVLLLLLLLNKIYWIRTIFVVAVHLVLLYIYYIILCMFVCVAQNGKSAATLLCARRLGREGVILLQKIYAVYLVKCISINKVVLILSMLPVAIIALL